MNTVAEKPVTALTLPERAAVALGAAQHEIKLRELVQASCRIIAVTNKAGRDECHTAYMVLKNTRCSITNLSDDATEDAKAFTKAVKAEAVRLLKITEAEEARLQALRDEWDAKIEAEKQAKIAAERARVEIIQKMIGSLRDYPRMILASDPAVLSAALKAAIDEFDGWAPHIDDYAEFVPAASEAIAESLNTIRAMMDAAIIKEAAALAAEQARIAEAARIEAERAELAQLRAAVAKVAAEQAAEQAAEAKRLADLAAAQEAEAKRQRDAIHAAGQKVLAQQAAADARDAQAVIDAAHGAAMVMDAMFDAVRLTASEANDAANTAFDEAHGGRELSPAEQAAYEAEGAARFAKHHDHKRTFPMQAELPEDQFFRCTATVSQCLADGRKILSDDDDTARRQIAEILADGRAGIDALTDAADEQSEKDSARLDWLEMQADFGLPWVARQSTTGRGYRLHQDPSGVHWTAREAIDAAIAQASAA